MKWEYSVTAWTYKFSDKSQRFSECYTRLESYGKDGWELVNIVEGLAYFKRPTDRCTCQCSKSGMWHDQGCPMRKSETLSSYKFAYDD